MDTGHSDDSNMDSAEENRADVKKGSETSIDECRPPTSRDACQVMTFLLTCNIYTLNEIV